MAEFLIDKLPDLENRTNKSLDGRLEQFPGIHEQLFPLLTEWDGD
jgi:hypothetical protein